MISVIQQKRNEFLLELYNKSNAGLKDLDSAEIGESIGLDSETLSGIEDFLKEAGFIEFTSYGPKVALKHKEILEVENIISVSSSAAQSQLVSPTFNIAKIERW